MRLLLIISMLLYCRGCHDAEAVTEHERSSKVAPYSPEAAHQKALKAIEDRRRVRDAERAAEFRESEREQRQAELLRDAMRAYILFIYCEEPVRRCRDGDAEVCRTAAQRRHPERACRINPAGADRIVRDRDLLGFAYLLNQEVRDRQRAGRWVPFGDAAPIWLAAVSYHEFSWLWRNQTRRGSIGERCAFQVTEAPIKQWARRQNLSRATPLTTRQATQLVAHDPEVCADVAVDWMEHCAEKCGGGDATSFLRVDDSGEPIRRWKNTSIRYRDDVGRWLTKRAWRHVVMPTDAALWMGAYATPGYCGGAPDVVRDRFETAWWLQRYLEARGGG
jgi:hypothetical protein